VEAHAGGIVPPQEEGLPKFGKVVATMKAGSDGRFTMSVPAPAKYTLTGNSPQFNDGAVCWSDIVDVAAGTTTKMDVL
jgi:hypothetical protein